MKNPAPAIWTHSRIGLWFVGFFGFIALVNAAMVTTALRTHSGLVTDHAYEKGIAYNRTISQSNAQSALHWQPSFAIENVASITHVTADFSLRDAAGKPIAISAARMVWARPTAAGEDVTVSLTPQDNGHVRSTLQLPQAGVWDVTIDATTATHSYQHHQRIVLQ